jgi:hypothetical protein
MFELETEIGNWKNSVGNQGAVSAEAMVELEGHLRELIVDLRKCGLSEREALLVGADRLGHPSELQQEFGKVNNMVQWRQPIVWMLFGYIAMRVAGASISAVVTLAGTSMAVAGFSGTVTGWAMVVVMFLGWVAMAGLAFRMLQTLNHRSDQLPLNWLVIAGGVLVIAPLVSFALRVVQLQLVNSSWFGESAIAGSIGGFAIHFLVVSVCFFLMCKFRKPAYAITQ